MRKGFRGMSVTTTRAGGACLGAEVVTIAGRPGSELEDALAALYADGARDVVVDVSRLDRGDGGHWIEVLRAYRTLFRERGGDIVVAGCDRELDDATLWVEPRLDEAIASVLTHARS